MRKNPLNALWAARKPAFGTWATVVHHPRFMKLLAVAGLDFVIIEMEHSDFTIAEVGTLCLVAREAGIVPIVRPAGLAPHDYTRPLDAGAMGLLLPNIDSAEQLESILQATKFYPRGKRILNLRGPHTDYERLTRPLEQIAELNQETVTVAMIESQGGLDNLDAICRVPGLSAVMVGPDDLSQDLGVPGDLQHPSMVAAIEHVIATCDSNGVPWGFSAQDPASAAKWIQRGICWMPYANDAAALFNTFSNAAKQLKESAGR
ncbi:MULTISPECIES: HpcH/HpaI aldolase family protein [Ramlibacter]|uniref:Aldolase n=1 Tax=Ramlibacter pinisoli TaxID=2682844 RepID=A0A6N8IR76_9BURK|nr:MULTISPECIES: aldolase/citrate lyase family protein [Ramlibacter]MBA2964453.1 aldolase [Ramlibacter sp. CGMCC 1.13660]MVQ29419.1 aldolase [Ramlibacter pinisoli]